MAPYAETLDGLLADPLIQAVMRADRVDPVSLRTMLVGVADRRRARGLDLKGARVWFCGQSKPKPQVKLLPPYVREQDRIHL